MKLLNIRNCSTHFWLDIYLESEPLWGQDGPVFNLISNYLAFTKSRRRNEIKMKSLEVREWLTLGQLSINPHQGNSIWSVSLRPEFETDFDYYVNLRLNFDWKKFVTENKPKIDGRSSLLMGSNLLLFPNPRYLARLLKRANPQQTQIDQENTVSGTSLDREALIVKK